MDRGKNKSIKMILLSLLLIVIGIVLLVLAVERVKSGWYRMHYRIRPLRAEASAMIFPVILILAGCINFYRGLKGKAFQWDVFSIISGHEDGSPYSCPHCGAKLEKGQFSCSICGNKIFRD